jgi:dihydrofolate reductase
VLAIAEDSCRWHPPTMSAFKRTLSGSCLLGSSMWKEWPSRVYMDAWSMSCMA